MPFFGGRALHVQPQGVFSLTPCIQLFKFLFHLPFQYLEKLDDLTRLQVFHLGFNQIEKMENMDHLTKLRELDLRCNHISKIEGIETLVHLQTLDLSSNLIETIPAWMGKKLKALRSLNLAANLLYSVNIPSLVSIADKRRMNGGLMWNTYWFLTFWNISLKQSQFIPTILCKFRICWQLRTLLTSRSSFILCICTFFYVLHYCHYSFVCFIFLLFVLSFLHVFICDLFIFHLSFVHMSFCHLFFSPPSIRLFFSLFIYLFQ